MYFGEGVGMELDGFVRGVSGRGGRVLLFFLWGVGGWVESLSFS